MTDQSRLDRTTHLTQHATERVAERKLSHEAVEIIRRHGDLERRQRSGCVSLGLSRSVAKRLDRQRAYPRKLIDEARETEVVITTDRQLCITAWKLPPDVRFRSSGARPRRQRTWRMEEI